MTDDLLKILKIIVYSIVSMLCFYHCDVSNANDGKIIFLALGFLLLK